LVGEAVGQHGEGKLHLDAGLEHEGVGSWGEQPCGQLFSGHQQQAVVARGLHSTPLRA
jgi:hypothetical protein